jgi:hypothetical protein
LNENRVGALKNGHDWDRVHGFIRLHDRVPAGSDGNETCSFLDPIPGSGPNISTGRGTPFRCPRLSGPHSVFCPGADT